MMENSCSGGVCVQMENIEIFVNFCEAYGVPRTSLFQTVDLFEGRNMAQVLSCIQQLGSEVTAKAHNHLSSVAFSGVIER